MGGARIRSEALKQTLGHLLGFLGLWLKALDMLAGGIEPTKGRYITEEIIT
jgi:hypothetical protein